MLWEIYCGWTPLNKVVYCPVPTVRYPLALPTAYVKRLDLCVLNESDEPLKLSIASPLMTVDGASLIYGPNDTVAHMRAWLRACLECITEARELLVLALLGV